MHQHTTSTTTRKTNSYENSKTTQTDLFNVPEVRGWVLPPRVPAEVVVVPGRLTEQRVYPGLWSLPDDSLFNQLPEQGLCSTVSGRVFLTFLCFRLLFLLLTFTFLTCNETDYILQVVHYAQYTTNACGHSIPKWFLASSKNCLYSC